METKPTSSKEIISFLAERFPECFSVSGAAKPLKVGIFQELAEQLAEQDEVSKTRLRQALRHYTSSWRYLKAIKVGAQRVNLVGESVAEIDQAQADHASKTLKESQEKFASKKPKDTDKKPSNSKPATKDSMVKKKEKPEGKRKEKFNVVKTTKSATQKIATKLKAIDSTEVSVGQQVKVQLGHAPMDATVTEVVGNDVSVQLSSGMVVKTQVKHLFTE
jgi:ProP effector